jgi:hypothetical protein
MAQPVLTYTPPDIFQGPMDVWIDLAPPPSANIPVIGVNNILLDANGAPTDTGANGKHLGLTEGPASLSVFPKTSEIRADNFAGVVDIALVNQECEIGFTIKETHLNWFPLLAAGPATTKHYAVAAVGADHGGELLQVGSMRSCATALHTLCLVGPKRNSPASSWVTVFAYKCYLKSAISLELGRAKETMLKLQWACIADLTRVQYDTVLQIVTP